MRAIRRRIARPFRNRAKQAQERGAWADALGYLQIVKRLNPQNLSILLPTANMQAELGQYDEAEATFRTASVLPEYLIPALIGLAAVSQRRNDWPEAQLRWEAVLKTMAQQQSNGPDATTSWPMSPAEVLLHIALARDMIGDATGAEADLMLGMALQPSIRRSAGAALMRARLLAPTDSRAAYLILRKANRRYPDDYSILYELTKAAAIAGQSGEAQACARALIALDPGNENTRSMIRDRGLLIGADQENVVV